MNTAENYVQYYQQQVELLISKTDLKTFRSDLDRLWDIAQIIGFSNAIDIILSYEHIHDIKRKNNWIEIIEYHMSKKNEKFLQAIDNSRFPLILNKLIFEESPIFKHKLFSFLSIITRKCSSNHIKNILELRKRLENDQIENFHIYDTMDSEYFQNRIKIQFFEPTNQINGYNYNYAYGYNHNTVENLNKDNIQPTVNQAINTTKVISPRANNNSSIFSVSTNESISTIDMTKRSSNKLSTIILSPKENSYNSSGFINKDFSLSINEYDLSKNGLNSQGNSTNDIDTTEPHISLIPPKTLPKLYPKTSNDSVHEASRKCNYAKNIVITELSQQNSPVESTQENQKTPHIEGIPVIHCINLAKIDNNAKSPINLTNVFTPTSNRETPRHGISQIPIIMNAASTDKNTPINKIHHCHSSPSSSKTKFSNQTQDSEKPDKFYEYIFPTIKERLDALKNAQKILNNIIPQKEPEEFIIQYKNLKFDIKAAKQELSNIFSSKPDDPQINEQLTKYIITVNNDIMQIEDNIRQKKKQFFEKGNTLKLTIKSTKNPNAFKLLKAKTFSSQEINPNYFLMNFEELLRFKTLQCQNVKCMDKGLFEEKGLKNGLNKDSNSINEPLSFSCMYYHSKIDKRRFLLVKPGENLFIYMNKGICKECFEHDKHENGCYYCKNYHEFYYHPANYKSKKCDLMNCQMKFCPFYHLESEKLEWENILSKNNKLTRANMKFRNTNTKSIVLIEPNNFFLNSTNISNTIINGTCNINNIHDMINGNENNRESSGSMPSTPKFQPLKPSEQMLKNLVNSCNQLKKLNENYDKDQLQFYIQYKPMKLDLSERKQARAIFKLLKGPDINQYGYNTILKFLCSFLNTQGGGILYIGVDDITRYIYGIEMNQRSFEEFKLNILQSLKDKFNPSVSENSIQIIRYPVITPNHHDINKINIREHANSIIKIEVKSTGLIVYSLKPITRCTTNENIKDQKSRNICV